MNKLLCACAAAALTFGAASGAAAQVVNFEDAPAQSQNNPVISDGFAFSQGNDCCEYSWANGQHSDNGTTFLIYSEGPTVMTKIGGGTFDVGNLDAGLSYYNDTNGFSLNLTGTRADSSVVTASLTLDFFFQTYTLSGFDNLVSLSFANDPEGYIAIDNINGSGAAPAPEPASWALMLGGFGMVGGALRSRKRASAFSFG